MLGKGGYEYLKEFILVESPRTPISVLTEIDNTFNQHEKDNEVFFVESKDDRDGIADLCNMYGQLFLSAFPDDDERESLENLIRSVRPGNKDIDQHIVHLKTKTSIVGSIVFSYFREASAGYIAYIVVDNNQRKKGYATKLFEKGMQIMEEDARRNNNKSVKYIYLELEKFEEKVPLSAYMWSRLGFKRLGLSYIQPPLNEKKNSSNILMLAVLPINGKEISQIPPEDAKLFIKSFFENAFEIPKPLINEYVNEMYRRLDDKDATRLYNII